MPDNNNRIVFPHPILKHNHDTNECPGCLNVEKNLLFYEEKLNVYAKLASDAANALCKIQALLELQRKEIESLKISVSHEHS